MELKHAGNGEAEWEKKTKEEKREGGAGLISTPLTPPYEKGHFDQCCIIGTVLGSYRVILLFNGEILNIGTLRLQSLAGPFSFIAL